MEDKKLVIPAPVGADAMMRQLGHSPKARLLDWDRGLWRNLVFSPDG